MASQPSQLPIGLAEVAMSKTCAEFIKENALWDKRFMIIIRQQGCIISFFKFRKEEFCAGETYTYVLFICSASIPPFFCYQHLNL